MANAAADQDDDEGPHQPEPWNATPVSTHLLALVTRKGTRSGVEHVGYHPERQKREAIARRGTHTTVHSSSCSTGFPHSSDPSHTRSSGCSLPGTPACPADTQSHQLVTPRPQLCFSLNYCNFNCGFFFVCVAI